MCVLLSSSFVSLYFISVSLGTRWCSWLRQFAINWMVTGSIPGGGTIFFIDIILPPVKLTQPLTEMSTRNISWEVKAAGA